MGRLKSNFNMHNSPIENRSINLDWNIGPK